jgi:hypothetical protein
MHINSRDRQIKLAPGVGFEPTTRLRRINSQASIGVLQNARQECIQSSKLAPAVGQRFLPRYLRDLSSVCLGNQANSGNTRADFFTAVC